MYGFIAPTEITDEYPVIDPLYGIDGFRNVDTLNDLNNIPTLRRRAGMVVGIGGGTQYYKLNPGPWNGTITDWTIFNSGGGGVFTGGTVTGPTIFTNGLTANTLTVNGVPITGDTYTTGGTYSNGTIDFYYNTGGGYQVTGITDNNIYTTGFTYSANTFYITDTSGNTFPATIDVMTGLTINGDLTVTGTTSLQGFSATTISATTIGTSGDCVDDIYVSNIHSCSPLNINPLDEGNVYFGSTSGVTIDLTNNRLGIGTLTPQYKLDVSGSSRVLTSMRVGADGNTFTSIDDNSIGISRTTDGLPTVILEAPTVLSANRQVARIRGREGVQLAYDTLARFQTYQYTSTIGLASSFDTNLTNDTSTILRLEGTKTPFLAVARGANFVPILSATSDNDTLIGLDINPTFQNSSFTGVTNLGLRVDSGVSSFGGNIALNNNTLHLGSNLGNTVLRTVSSGNDLQLYNNNATGNLLLNSASRIIFGQNTSATNWWATFFNTGNLVIQSGGTHVDAGYRLDVNGTTRIQGQTTLVQPQGSDYIVFSSSTLANSGQTMFIKQTASNQFVFGTGGPGIGVFMRVGPTNLVDFSNQSIQTNGSATFGTIRPLQPNILNLNEIPSGITAGTQDYRGVLVDPTVNFGGTYSGNFIGYLHNPTITSMANGRHIAMQIVSGDVLLNTTSGNVGIGTTTPSAKLQVSGTTLLQTFTGTTGLISAATQNVLTIVGSGNTNSFPIFSVQGSQGELFSVTDSLTGSLFSVNDISGLPVVEVFSDDTILMGSFDAPSLNTTTRVIATTGTTNVYSIPTSAYTGAFFDYTVSDGTNLRAGNIMSIWSGSSVNITETQTTDFGNTSGLTFNMVVSSGNAILRTSGTTGNWTVKTIVRSI